MPRFSFATLRKRSGECQLLYNLSKNLDGGMTSLLFSTSFERIELNNSSKSLKDLRFAELDQVFTSFGASLAW